MKKLLLLIILVIPLLLLFASAKECYEDSDCKEFDFKEPECVRCLDGKCVTIMCNLYCEYGYVPGSCQCECNDAPCEPKWKCTSWSKCNDGFRYRECVDKNECGIEEGKPSEIEGCSKINFFRNLFLRWRNRFRR